jgi:hypothetical protein
MTISSPSVSGTDPVPGADSATLAATVNAVHAAGARLLELYSSRARPSGCWYGPPYPPRSHC